MSKKLTLKQQRFVDYYLQTGNATKSAKLAGYITNERTYRQIGYANMTNNDIKRAIQARLIKDKITPDYVLTGISTLAEQGSKDSDKLRAYELLGKYLKLFTDTESDKPTEIILKLGNLEPVKTTSPEDYIQADNSADNTAKLPPKSTNNAK